MVKVAGNVIGLKELESQLKAMVKAVSPPEASEIMKVGAEEIAHHVRLNIREQGLVDEGTMLDSTEAYKINQYAAGVRVAVVYAAVHEYGLPQQPITDRQRAFFWYKYSQTGDKMWLALALSQTYTIPARPYFRRGVDTGKSDAVQVIAREVENRLASEAGN